MPTAEYLGRDAGFDDARAGPYSFDAALLTAIGDPGTGAYGDTRSHDDQILLDFSEVMGSLRCRSWSLNGAVAG